MRGCTVPPLPVPLFMLITNNIIIKSACAMQHFEKKSKSNHPIAYDSLNSYGHFYKPIKTLLLKKLKIFSKIYQNILIFYWKQHNRQTDDLDCTTTQLWTSMPSLT